MSSSAVTAEGSGPARIAPGPRGCLLVGSLPQMRTDAIKLLMDTFREYGDVSRIQLVEWIHLLAHPDHVKHVLQDNHTNYPKGFGYSRMKPLVGEGLLTSAGDFWKRQRRLAQPAFHRQKLGRFVDTFVRRTQQMLGQWDARGPKAEVDVHHEMMRLTLAIVGDTLFSMDLLERAEEVGKALGPALEIINDRFVSLFVVPQAVPTPQNRRFKQSLDVLDRVVNEVIAQRRAGDGEEHHDLLDMLMRARDEDTHEGMTDRQLRDEVMTMLLAGHETTANALAWTFYLLSLNPAVERKLYEEVSSVLGDRACTLDDLPRLQCTHMVLEESLRLYPPAWLFTRMATEADQIGGYTIPAGSTVFLVPYVTHRHPAFWDNPEGFDPERFSPERSAGRHRFAFFPFAAGPRMCIGKEFAMMESVAALASVVQRYRLTLVPGHKVEPEPTVTLRPLNGIRVNLHPRAL